MGHIVLSPPVSLLEISRVLEETARLEGPSIHQTGLGVAAGVAESTALRVTRRMLETGVFARQADPGDKRLLLISLSDAAAERMRAYLAATRAMAAFTA